MPGERERNEISVPEHIIDISEESGVRYLNFGSDSIQGAMRIARPWSLELEYTREMMAGLLLRSHPDWPRSCLMVGLGAASQLRFLHRHFPDCRITALEINPAVISICQQFFKLPPESPQLGIIAEDASTWIRRAPKAHYDLILLDGFAADGCPAALDSPGFYLACRAVMSEQGVLACNLLSRSRGFQARARRIRQAFERRCLILPPSDSGNAIALSATGTAIDTDLATMQQRAKLLHEQTGLDLRPALDRLRLSRSLPADHLTL